MVTLSGEQDAYTAPELRESLATAAAGERPKLVVDLAPVTFLDSTTLGVLVGSAKRAIEAGGEQRIACDQEHILKVFDISGTREMLGVVPTVDEALRLLRGAGAGGGEGGGSEP